MRLSSTHILSIGIPTVVGCSYMNPELFRSGGTLRSERWKDALIVGMFATSGLGIAGWSSFRSHVIGNSITRHAWIQGISLFGLPLITMLTAPFVVEGVLQLPSSCSTALSFLSCLPTTIGLSIASTRAAGGDVALATLHSAVGNSFGPLIVPVTANIATGVSPSISVSDLITRLTTLVVLPLFGGIAARSRWEAVLGTKRLSTAFSMTQQGCLLMMLATVFSTSFYKQQRPRSLAGDGGDTAAATLTMHQWARVAAAASFYYTGYFCCAMAVFRCLGTATMGAAPSSIAAVYCSTQKTAAMGLALVDLLFAGHKDLDIMVGTLLMFHFYQILFGTTVGPLLLRRCFA